MAESTLLGQFSAAFGGPPAGVWSAPGRVNLVGEHTDYNQGLCLPIALPHRTRAALRPREDRLLLLRSAQSEQVVEIGLDDVGPGAPDGWGAYPAGVLWALEQAGHQVGGLEALVDSEVPVGAGLSSSAALECAVAVGACDLWDLDLAGSDQQREQLVRLCVRAENDIAQAPTGGLDQSASLRCQTDSALLLDCRDGSVQQVPFDLAAAGMALLVIDTRAEHTHAGGEYAQRRHQCEDAARALSVGSLRDVEPAGLAQTLARLDDPTLRRRVRHVVTEIDRVRQCVAALRGDDFAEVGRTFDASHASMRDDFEISCAELDVAVDSATAAGAYGARMTGGGFGGSAIALVAAENVEAVAAAVTAAFSDNGFGSPSTFPVTAGPSAARDVGQEGR